MRMHIVSHTRHIKCSFNATWQSALAPTLQACYGFLDLTSRSFAAVIQALHPSLRSAHLPAPSSAPRDTRD